MFLPHPRVKVSIVESLRDREVACSASDRQGSNFESCVWRTVSSQSSHHPQDVLLAQVSLYVHKGGLKPDSFHFISFDDIQLYVIFDPSVPGDREQAIRRMEACVKEIRLWMASRWLKLNDDKTELSSFLSAHHQKTYGQCDITIGESTISPASHVRNLGVENLRWTVICPCRIK